MGDDRLFSDSLGITSSDSRPLQVDSMDQALRNALWNWVLSLLDSRYSRDATWNNWRELAVTCLWDEFFHLRLDEIPHEVSHQVLAWFAGAKWFEVYNLIQFLMLNERRFLKSAGQYRDSEQKLNGILEREMSGYRSVKRRLVAVTSVIETAEISKAAAGGTGFEGVGLHITKALDLLSQKPAPDFRNSIKESISAVESAAVVIGGDKNLSFDKAMKAVKAKHKVHGSMEAGFVKLFGYTSDASGIRHAVVDDSPDASFADAKFMLVACSAFANFLIDASR